MIYVKVVDGVIIKFPYSLEDLRMEHPNVSFPNDPPEEVLNAYFVHKVKYYPYPEYDHRTQKIIVMNSPIIISDEWSIRHDVVNKTAEEIAAYDNDEIKSLRQKILDAIDVKTNELITYGWIYNGTNVRLTVEDQLNFEGEFNLIKDMVSSGIPEINFFPVNYKVWTTDDGLPVFMSIANIVELRSFLCGGKKHIRDCLSNGWVVKNAAISMTIDELKVWKDPRNV